MKKFLENLRTNAWRTSSSRYNAARRYKTREIFSTASLALLSAATIAVAFFEKAYVISGSEVDKALNLMSICLGLFLLVISLIEWGVAAGVKAEALHRNAESLTAFRVRVEFLLSKLGSGDSVGWDEVNGLAEEYEQIKNQCPYNHDPIDSEYFDVSKRFDLEYIGLIRGNSIKCWKVLWIKLCWQTQGLKFFIIVWLVVFLLGWKILSL